MVKNDCCVVFVANGKGGLSLLAIEGCFVGPGPSPSTSPTPTPTATPSPIPGWNCDIDRDWDWIKKLLEDGLKINKPIDWDKLRELCKQRAGGKTRVDWSTLMVCLWGQVGIDWGKFQEKCREKFRFDYDNERKDWKARSDWKKW